MRGTFEDRGGLFSYIAPEARGPTNHPLRKIRALVRDVLGELNRSQMQQVASDIFPGRSIGQAPKKTAKLLTRRM
jgi:hypothetical protein